MSLRFRDGNKTNFSCLSHFELPSDVIGKYKAKCNHSCLYISISGKTTSNLLTHLKRKHPSVLTNKIVKEVPENQPSMNTFCSTPKKYSKTDPRQVRKTANIVNFVAGTLQSFSIVDSEEFKQLIEEKDAGFTLTCRQHLSKVPIPNKCEQLHEKISKMLQEAASVCDVCVTVDGLIDKCTVTWELQLISYRIGNLVLYACL